MNIVITSRNQLRAVFIYSFASHAMKLRRQNKLTCSGNNVKYISFCSKYNTVKRISGFTRHYSFIYHRSGGTMDDNSLSGSNVKVAVRVRPMNRRGECNAT